MSNWGDQLGSLAEGVGFGAANYELAKHDPQAYVAVQKTSLVILIVFIVIIAIGIIVAMISSGNKGKNNDDIQKNSSPSNIFSHSPSV